MPHRARFCRRFCRKLIAAQTHWNSGRRITNRLNYPQRQNFSPDSHPKSHRKMIQFPAQNFSASNWIIFFCTRNYSKFAITNQLVFITSCIFLGRILDQPETKIQQKQRRLKIAGEPMPAFSTPCYINFGTKPGLEPFCSKSGLKNCQKKLFF